MPILNLLMYLKSPLAPECFTQQERHTYSMVLMQHSIRVLPRVQIVSKAAVWPYIT